MWDMWRKAKAAPVADAGISKTDHEAAVAAAHAAGHAEGLAAARAEYDAAVATARAEGFAEGEKRGHDAALARVRAIFALPEAKDRHPQALVIALAADITLEAAPRILSICPTWRTTATSPVPSLDQRGVAPLH